MVRNDGRAPADLRPVRITIDTYGYAEGSALIEMGKTRVLCAASVEEGVPQWLRGQQRGWVTGEYALLPRSTAQRTRRERNGVSGRTQEIQRLIGRALRAAVDLSALGERTLTLDCDVLQADGGTRTAAITGAWVALREAIDRLLANGELDTDPIQSQVAAVSVGLYRGVPILDLDYAEDSSAETDMNLVMDGEGRLIEIQGTAEGHPFTRAELDSLLELGAAGIRTIQAAQRAALED